MQERRSSMVGATQRHAKQFDPAAFTRYVASEIERWTPAVRSVEKTGKQGKQSTRRAPR